MEYLPTLVGYILFLLALLHALLDGHANRTQRMLLLLTLFIYGTLLEASGVNSGLYRYPREPFVNMGVVPLSVSLAWVGIIYSVILIVDRLRLGSGLRILTVTLIALSLDWGMDPVATRFGIWVWRDSGAYFGIPSFNMVGWFFIPISYLLVYGFAWKGGRQPISFLTIAEVDGNNSWQRKLYTIIVVAPLSLALTAACSAAIVAAAPGLLKLSLEIMSAWAVVTVLAATGIVIWRRDYLRRKSWLDIIPALVLAWIAANYTFLALTDGLGILFFVMFLSATPLWFILAISLLPPKKNSGF
ncbi:MAG: hypothetical protein CVU54_18485 [Deltaproteobacteria bacterium HGW-Deltaproteobacteria-12]|jgi:uncharacterized membrane protein|nr:MAG: hypothetical protein CVU54_18485 [Deltaproteobacteria bacterium HGW-Deltaproteobacteria-12]